MKIPAYLFDFQLILCYNKMGIYNLNIYIYISPFIIA